MKTLAKIHSFLSNTSSIHYFKKTMKTVGVFLGVLFGSTSQGKKLYRLFTRVSF